MNRRTHRNILKAFMPKGWQPPAGDGRAQFQGSKAKARAMRRLGQIKPIPERKL